MGRLGKFVFSLLLLIIVGYGVLVWFVNSEVEKAFTAAVNDVDGLTLVYDDLWVDIGDHTVTLTRPESTLPTGEQLAAEEVVIHSFDERHPIPHFIKVTAKGLVVQAEDARAYGLNVTQDLTGDMVLDYRYNPQAKALTLNSLSFDDSRLGRAALSGTLTELDLDAFRMEKLIGLHIKDATLEFTDRAYLGTVFARLADTLGSSVEGARQQLDKELQAIVDLGEQKGKKQAAQEIRNFKRFLDHSGSVTIKAAPERPVPYIYLLMGRDIYENFDLLNLSIETKPIQ